MVTPAFGFSAGDFIAAINLVLKVSKALQDSDGASVEIHSLLQELHQLQVVLEQLQDLPPESSPTLSHLNALRSMALTVQIPLQDFLRKMEKYKAAAKKDPKFSRWKEAEQKIKWALIMQEDVVRLRAVVTMKIVTVSLLMAIPIGQTLFYIRQSTIENRNAVESSRKDLREAKEKLSKDMNETRLQVRRTGRNVSLDTGRLLKICVGLRVGINRLERAHYLARRHQPQDTTMSRTISTANAKIETSVNSLKLSISLVGIAVGELLRSFSGFSKEVIEHLKQLHLSNMEAYLLLRRILENIPKQPSGLSADDIRFVDVLQREWRLPYTIFCDYEIFEKMLQCKFKGFPGESKVIMGEYLIMNSKAPYQIINRQSWGRTIFPGSSIDMSMLLSALRMNGDRCPQSSCPGIGVLNMHSKMFVCSACKLQYFPLALEHPTGSPPQEFSYPTMLGTPVPNLRLPEPTTFRGLRDRQRTSGPVRDPQSHRQSEIGIGVDQTQEDERAREIEELRVFRKVILRVNSERHQPVNNKDETSSDDGDNLSSQTDSCIIDNQKEAFHEWQNEKFIDEWDRMAYQSSKSIGLLHASKRQSPFLKATWGVAVGDIYRLTDKVSHLQHPAFLQTRSFVKPRH